MQARMRNPATLLTDAMSAFLTLLKAAAPHFSRTSCDERESIMRETHYSLSVIGWLHSPLKEPGEAPRQGHEGAPDAWLEVNETVAEGLEGIAVGDEILVITWLHKAQRGILKTHPRDDEAMPLAGVFATRSPDRPNPLGLHRVAVLAIAGKRLQVGPIEAIDGTPVVDIKPVLHQLAEA